MHDRITSSPVGTWMGDRQGRLSAVNLCPFVGVDFNLWPTVHAHTAVNQSITLHNTICVQVSNVKYTAVSTHPQQFETSQAARQVLMATASVLLKHETSTLRQSHNFISINLKFGVSDNVRDVTSPAKFVLDPISGRDATWRQHTQVLWLFFYSSTELQPIPVNQFSRTIPQKTHSGVRKTLLGMRNVQFWNLGVFHPKNTPKSGRNRQWPAKNRMSNNSEAVRDMRHKSMNNDYETGVALSDFVNKTCVKRTLRKKSRWP